MAYIIFGFALGTFICGLIEKFSKNEQTSWIKPKYLFLLSAAFFLLFVFVGWPLLQLVFAQLDKI